MIFGIRKVFPYELNIKLDRYVVDQATTITDLNCCIPEGLVEWCESEDLPRLKTQCAPLVLTAGDSMDLTVNLRLRNKRQMNHAKRVWKSR